MNHEKRKQCILIILAFCLIGIGCFNFKSDEIVQVAAEEMTNEENLGDVQLVNAEVSNQVADNVVLSGAIVPNDTEETNTNAETNSKTRDAYFTETKLERDSMYSEMLETYQNMLEKTEVSADQKAIATQEITNITNTKNGIMISENLIKNKGFEDVVILVNNGIVSVIVKANLLNEEQIAKIQNIVARELNVEVKNINISYK